MPLRIPKSLQNTGKSSSAPISSISTVVFRIKPVRRTIPPTCGAAMESCMVLLCQRPIFMPDARITAIPIVITPIPPIWISVMITHCPKNDQYVAVSCTISPVTQVAEVAVNSASGNGVNTCCAEEIGSISSRVPAIISPKKLMIITWKELRPLRFLRFFNSDIFIPLIRSSQRAAPFRRRRLCH